MPRSERIIYQEREEENGGRDQKFRPCYLESYEP
jgi:hypothetical protein